ncbi:QRFP-like peptide receptor [Branchiostoma lanceolatum]|uniref:QRFPR protein n=1 Tax=Branchiostoma lanceolatum TaxID=7740 RepID=A0A8J9Z2Y2_BRALA|nr:QRFPR [Branchiostoma lanceolatum]
MATTGKYHFDERFIASVADRFNQSVEQVEKDLLSRFNLTWRPKIENLPPSFTVTVCTLYAIIFVMSLIGNSMVIYAVASNRKMRSITNVFLVSLAVSDLLITVVSMPWSVLHALDDHAWNFGDFMCRVPQFVQVVSVTASLMTLTCIAVDRYIAILHPLNSGVRFSILRVSLTLLSVWVVAVTFGLPLLVYIDIVTRSERSPIPNPHNIELFKLIYYEIEWKVCTEAWPNPNDHFVYSMCFLIVLYTMPLLVMTCLYGRVAHYLWVRQPIGDNLSQPRNAVAWEQSRKTRRVIRMLVSIVGSFAICWGPFFVIQVVKTAYVPAVMIQLLAHVNCAVNPIIYALLSEKFRDNLRCCSACIKLRQRRSRMSLLNTANTEEVDMRTRSSSINAKHATWGRQRTTSQPQTANPNLSDIHVSTFSAAEVPHTIDSFRSSYPKLPAIQPGHMPVYIGPHTDMVKEINDTPT